MMRFLLAPQIGQTIKLSADPASADMLSAFVASLASSRETPSIEIVSTSINSRNIYSYPERSGVSNNSF
ncbi:MAG: hypothetical protein J7527_00015 [Chitinophagaceae bacterium]|nr:hypothetical protein [Chitinophagaceae bacterium]